MHFMYGVDERRMRRNGVVAIVNFVQFLLDIVSRSRCTLA